MQQNWDISPLCVYCNLWCYIEGGRISIYCVIGNFHHRLPGMLSKGGAILGVLCQNVTVCGRNAGNEVCSYIDWKCVYNWLFTMGDLC